ncbi:flavoprotein [Suillus decipiens]|nr:flavoprotein [Suillus decipiens]
MVLSCDRSSSRELLILYAMETGTAQETADYIARECRRVCFHCRVQSMDAYPPVGAHLVVFVVSTGVPNTAMTSLWNMLLRSDLSDDLFKDMDFCLFGLGDTAYEKFFWSAKKLSRRMQSLGGSRMQKNDELMSIEGADGLYDYCQRVKRTTWEVLSEFRSARIPREYVFDLFLRLRPREFPIASSIEVNSSPSRETHLCVAIMRHRTKLKIHRKRVCTSYLSGLKAGTDIAPTRAIIEQRTHEGCTKRKLRYYVACSRDGPEGVKWIYVQDLMKEVQDIWTMSGQQRGILIVSGSSNKIPTAVREVVRGAAEKFRGKSNAEAVEYVTTMEREGRCVMDKSNFATSFKRVYPTNPARKAM